MRAQLRAIACVACLALLPWAAWAQGLSPENRKIIDDFATAVEKAYAIEREDGRAAALEIPLPLVQEMRAAALRVKGMVGGRVDFTTLARARKTRLDDASVYTTKSPLEKDTQSLKGFYALLRDDIDSRKTPELERVKDAVQAFQHAQLEVAQTLALERLHAFEVKYGPGSAQLNAVELLANFWLQRVCPFKPGPDGPSPWEMMGGYSTTYLTAVNEQAQVVTVVEVGLRHYNFGYDPDVKSGLRSYLTPRYWTAALAIGDGEDGGLRLPFRREPRLGAMVSWGDFKVAYLYGKEHRWRLLVSRQLQLLPHVL